MLVIVFALNFFVGKKVNCKIAAMWLAKVIPILEENFALLGFGEEANYSLSQIKYDEFEYYASGRDNCKYLFMSLKTKKRQDVITGGLLGLLWPDEDKMILDIPIEASLPLEFMICRKQNVKRTQQEMPNIKNLISVMKSDKLKATNFAVLAETNEVSDLMLNSKLVAGLTKYEKYIEFLHITDQQVYTNYPLVLKAEILFGDSPAEYNDSVKVIELILDLVDFVATAVKLPARVLDVAKKNRSAEDKKKEKESREKKEEEIQQKKEEKERELREKLKKLAPDERRKLEEKIKMDNKKKEMKGKNKVIKF
uniref:Coiled-coil domain-containing protein 47 n=1 Tax=Euplotes harpa TaxID=151035 RepID=A0A7S3JIM0_9SPIT|mmetsp:Transcript_42251/g.49136  ORF Transcript_42251/g.49136 Transcript_42251/m.49136 type:complete len:310 (+) Transcript_42251:379-1308(+)